MSFQEHVKNPLHGICDAACRREGELGLVP
jgi:hypothetical protein